MSFKTLAEFSAKISKEYPDTLKENAAWAGSDFDWMRTLSPGTKGAIGRQLVCGLLHHHGITCFMRKNLVKVNGLSISVKTSLMWGAGNIKFQNIRDNNFDFVLCQGIYPSASFGWLIPKEEIWVDGALQERPGLALQHGGSGGGDDAWIGVNPRNVHDWMKPYGGTTSALIKVAQTSL